MLKRILPITVSKEAWNKMKNILHSSEHHAFLFSAKSGGCNGFNYKLETINKNEHDDILNKKPTPIFIHKTGTTLIIAPTSELLLIGTTIDFVQEDFSKNIFDSKFTFAQPKDVSTSCGCGVSFSPK